MVPEPGREKLLDLLHEEHPGIVRMKNLAKSYLGWPRIDEAIETKLWECQDCHAGSGAIASLGIGGRPGSRIHSDYAGPFMGSMFFLS